MEECCRTGQATYDNMAMHITCWIPKVTNTNSGYVNAYSFSNATMVARTCLYVTLHVQYIASLFIFDLLFYCLFIFY